MLEKNQIETDRRVLILAEKEGEEIAPISFELLQAGRELADKLGGKLCLALLGHGLDDISNQAADFSDEVYVLDDPLLATFQGELYAHALERLCRSISPYIVLMGHTLDNLDLAPKLACKMGTRLVTDCIGLDIEQETGNLLATKPVYGDNALATFINELEPQMVTLRPKVYGAAVGASIRGKVTRFDPAINGSLLKTELVKTVPGEAVSLDKADAIVAGGRGIKRIEGLKDLETLIDILKRHFDHVELGASRPLIDAGWLPPSRQLGLTGEKARPELYIAIGISGSLQHLTGIYGSKKILAINKDEQAPIFRYADYGIVEKYEEMVPALTEELKELP